MNIDKNKFGNYISKELLKMHYLPKAPQIIKEKKHAKKTLMALMRYHNVTIMGDFFQNDNVNDSTIL